MLGGRAGQRIWQDSSSGLVCCVPPGEKGDTGAASSLGKSVPKSPYSSQQHHPVIASKGKRALTGARGALNDSRRAAEKH